MLNDCAIERFSLGGDIGRELRHKVGLYRVTLNGQIVVLGTGTDKSGGIAKRLSDFHRPSPSGRNITLAN